jgi:type II secretory ATPase GspE/PulE/Tfp pilus assembly ATPase PilB-like protein
LVPEIQELILEKASAKVIRQKADLLGMVTLMRDGEEKVTQGITTEEELLRVTSL